jgi:hypothetical protein
MILRDHPCWPRSRASRAAWARARRIDKARVFATKRIEEAAKRVHRVLTLAGYDDPAETLTREMLSNKELVDQVLHLVFTRALDGAARREA